MISSFGFESAPASPRPAAAPVVTIQNVYGTRYARIVTPTADAQYKVATDKPLGEELRRHAAEMEQQAANLMRRAAVLRAAAEGR